MNSLDELTTKLGLRGTLGLGILIAALFSGGIYQFILAPYETQIEIEKTKAEDKEKSVAQLKVMEKEKEQVYNKGAEIYATYLKGAKLLPDGEQISQVLEAVEAKAGQNGNKVLSFEAFKLGVKSTSAPNVNERIIEGELQGNHSALIGFLRNISYYERITEVKAISAKTNEKGSETLKFVLAAYYLPTKIDMPGEVMRRAHVILARQAVGNKNSNSSPSSKSITTTELQAKTNQ